MKSSKEIRQAWIDYFVSKGHLFIESKSLIPHEDPSLLWINSGVATLKDYFSGKKKPPCSRLTNSQKSIRTNDIENVGVTARHHTFFEMLGNFSIGDYFKNEAIEFAHEVVTQVFKLDQKKIYITYFEEDLEVKNKWMSLGYSENQLIAGSRKLNFWDVGSGPCGPNTEIFYDRGKKYHEGGPELIANDIENDRFIEIWNIVFSQYNNLGNGKYVELVQKNIDTGAGLERIASILQDGPTNFDTDLFLPIIQNIEQMTNFKYDINNYFKKDPKQELINKYFKIIADHMRAITNAISDGEKPSNTQRGYIIRRLIRRAYYAGKKLNINFKSFLYKLVPIVVDTLIFDVDINTVSDIIKKEEELFSATIEQGKKMLEDEMKNSKTFDFDVKGAFKLYETYGFPIEMTNEILIENNFRLDFDKLSKLKKEHSEKSKSNTSIINFAKQINSLSKIKEQVSEFIGYDHTELKDAIIVSLLNEDIEIKKSLKNQICYLILKQTPMYATSGGQHHDHGHMVQENNLIEVIDVFKDKNNNNIHVVKGEIDSTKPINVFIDKNIRQGLMRNHSATHLTFAALRKLYGETIQQLGSDNNQDRLTFDFPLNRKPTNNEIEFIEQFIRKIINENILREYKEMTIDEAKKIGAIMTISETEYFDSNHVRVVEFAGITSDLCGGTHVNQTKDIEAYKIINVESKGTGIYRIRAITSKKTVMDYLKNEYQKNISIFDSLFKKYINLLKTKETNFKSKQYNFPLKEDILYLENIIKEIHFSCEELNQAIRKLIKLPNKNVGESIKLKSVYWNGYDTIFIKDLEKENIKDIAVQTREKNHNSLIICVSKFLNNKLSIVITSKKINVIDLVKNNLIFKNLRGGGNNLIWQGVAENKEILDVLDNK